MTNSWMRLSSNWMLFINIRENKYCIFSYKSKDHNRQSILVQKAAFRCKQKVWLNGKKLDEMHLWEQRNGILKKIKILRRPSKNVISKSMRRHIYQNPNRNDAILRASALAQLSSTLTLVMLNHTVSECVPVPKRTTKQKMHVGFRISSRMPCVCVLSCSFCYSWGAMRATYIRSY